ncbi:MAG: ATP-dependent Clp protease proteolytic subunit, partial [Candidatus Eremiobacteraeota bacterium]|nr:ATP-dependent Clp protease proteolytic subunit [Candidatus Eremiobacteraeota bacterium]
MLALVGALGTVRAAPAGGAVGDVIIVPIEGTVDEGMAHLVQRAVAEANATHARAVVLDVNTPGGLVSAAFEIRDAMLSANVPTLAYVSERAYSAGALISLSARRIVMAPGSSIGAAEPIPNDPKHVSALRAEFASTAGLNHRDETLAAAMVDKSVAAPGYKKPGTILTFTAAEAL